MNKYFTGNSQCGPPAQKESGRELSPPPAEIVVRTVRTGGLNYGLETVNHGDVHVSQCAGFEASPRAFSTESFMM
jgi:hypothetical protein